MSDDPDVFLKEAKMFVVSSENGRIRPSDLYIVWFAKVLKNYKALISTDKEPGLYWEVTFNGSTPEGDNAVAYVDRYNKVGNTAITVVR